MEKKYIELDSAITAIIACKRLYGVPGAGQGIDVLDAYDAVRSLPTADVVPVVRCRDCKYWYGETDDGHEHSCASDALLRPGNHFCAYGLRRE